MSIEIPETLWKRLSAAALNLGKTEPDCVRSALESWPEGMEDARAYTEALDDWERDGRKTVPLEALRGELRGPERFR